MRYKNTAGGEPSRISCFLFFAVYPESASAAKDAQEIGESQEKTQTTHTVLLNLDGLQKTLSEVL
jgi:hypothetical protein